MVAESAINESAICIMVHNKASNRIELDSVPIKNTLANSVTELKRFCDSSIGLDSILKYIKRSKQFEVLSKYFSYCSKLSNAYEGVQANNQEIEKRINEMIALIAWNKKHGAKDYDAASVTRSYKNQIAAMYELWAKAYAIEAAYQECRNNTNILAYSHRLCGWSNPVKQLTPNFSVEIKTNFGYGSVSYFYTKLKYKNIEILPFSDWVNYEWSAFSEIARYTRKHQLLNSSWLEAMIFCRDASNLSLTNEEAFLSKYVVAECEGMVEGLEKILTESSFTFKSGHNSTCRRDKKGDVLLEFRGEKISGALDFINSILQFKNFVSITTFIKRIEDCNKRIQPILASEAIKFTVKLAEFEASMTVLKPKYLQAVAQAKDYDEKRRVLKTAIMAAEKVKESDVDMVKFNKAFLAKYPGFTSFEEGRVIIFNSYQTLSQQILNTKKVLDAVTLYNNKIIAYFKGR
jgi:hypothetical protein